MGGRERTYRPRARTVRSLDGARSTNAPPSQPLPAPEATQNGWFLPDPLSQRLHQKSALGRRTDGGILLTAEEVMFCHWYRHVPLPSGTPWFDEQLAVDPNLIQRTIALDVLRNGGERVVPVVHLEQRFGALPSSTWAIRWERHELWTSHNGFSQVRLQRTHDPLDWGELSCWVEDVHALGHVAELVVVDDEFDTTVYHLSLAEPSGGHPTLASISDAKRDALMAACERAVNVDGGFFIGHQDEWPLPTVGVPHFSGRFLRPEEHQWLLGFETADAGLYASLMGRGLLLRPGFKYGCRWRAYEEDIEVAHAPWLIQPENEAPSTWEEVCLAVRLAEGVNKRWLCARSNVPGHSFLNIKRVG